jgi:hypothetical protein
MCLRGRDGIGALFLRQEAIVELTHDRCRDVPYTPPRIEQHVLAVNSIVLLNDIIRKRSKQHSKHQSSASKLALAC